MSSADSCGVLNATLVDAVNLVPGMIVETGFFGVLSLLVLFSTITIIRQGVSSRSRIFMLAATTVMYFASGTNWALNVYTLMREIRDPQGWADLPMQTEYMWSLVTTAALFVNFWISDMIVVWRACVVWTWDRRVTIPSFLLVMTALILGIVEVTTSHATPDHRAFQANIYGVLALFASLISNIWATSLVGYKAWCHRRDIQAYLGNAGTTSAVHSVLVLLVESGFLYCIIWVIFILGTVLSALHKPIFTHVVHTISSVVPQLVSLYPATIIRGFHSSGLAAVFDLIKILIMEGQRPL